MNIPVHDDYVTISFEPPTSKANEYICLQAEMDLVVAFSACPQVSAPNYRIWLALTRKDILSINCGTPVDAHFEIF
jgi:uncharacterized protein YcgI (DUF1989 family)